MSKQADNRTWSNSKKSEKNVAAQWYKAKEENGCWKKRIYSSMHIPTFRFR